MELFLQIEGVKGPVTTPSTRAGWFDALSFSWGGIEKGDTVTFGATRRLHSPLKVVRLIDAASSLLYDAMIRPVTFTITVAADVPDAKGVLKPAATYTLKEARVAEIRLLAANGGADAVSEEVELTYGQIQVQHDPSGAKYQDGFAST